MFDFASAFPHIGRRFILLVMRAAMFPTWLISLAEASWTHERIVNRHGTEAYPMHSGVGQGCPAAAVLFLVGMTPLLVLLGQVVSGVCGEVLPAYADDIAMVLTDATRPGPMAKL